MTNGEPGRIYWSKGGQRFYQEGRRGAVGREQAIGHLSRDARGRLRDEKQQFVPDASIATPQSRVRRFVGHDAQGRPFITSEFRDRLTTREAYADSKLPANQMLVVRTVIHTPDGKVRVSYSSSAKGARINADRLDDLANKRTAGQLRGKGYEISTGDIGKYTLKRDYILRTVNVRG